LVGRYVLYQQRVAYVKKLRGDGTLEIIETMTRSEARVSIDDVSLIEDHGVSVFILGKEPEFVRNSEFTFIVDLKSDDMTLLNILQQKMRI
jgi:hypothetical protein